MTQLADRRVALLDANVLFPFRKRDTLLRFHHAGLFQARWTERILDEWTLNLLEQKPHLERSVRSRRQAIREHFAEAMVTGYEPLIGTLDLVGLLEEATPCRGVDGTPPRQLPTGRHNPQKYGMNGA